MKIQLNSAQRQMLAGYGITILPDHEFSEDEALDLLDQVYDIEVLYAQDADTNAAARRLANEYAAIADAIRNQIPEDET